ncbi:transcriptional regulator GcvA [Rhodobacteraceae bacterium NNCM2]|nr:transcriptional regulator GcvA [Coraliihabitans acroporae]
MALIEHSRLPPLTALRAFEAACRHMSFAKAAEELFVTPAALSYQIKSLEEFLGVQLFRRLNRAIELTEEGEVLRPGVAQAFNSLQDAVRALARMQDDSTLTVTAGPAFTAKWLAPRMFLFAEKHPEIELRFVASLKMLDFVRDGVEAAIRFGTHGYPGCFHEVLIEDWVTPYCTPEIAAQLDKPADILNFPLIHDDSVVFMQGSPTWDMWFAKMGVMPETLAGSHFSNADHAIDAASEGGGIVLGRSSLIERDLSRGRLVAPFDAGLDSGGQFRFVCPLGRETEPHTAAFLEWIRTETEGLRQMRREATLLP